MHTPAAAKPSGSMVFLTLLALMAFAANSLLCRMALGGQLIDAASFTSVRLVSGALVLWLLARYRRQVACDGKAPQVSARRLAGSWLAGLMLFLYAATFSFAYLELSAGTGALILFGSVQITMLSVALLSGERLRISQWTGLLMAFSGLVYLMSPGVTAPSPFGALMMTLSGVAWGFYTLSGRGRGNPLQVTSGNFLRAFPLALLMSVVIGMSAVLGWSQGLPLLLSTSGLLLAVASGAVASGLGYVVWYRVLPYWSASSAASFQLAVPVFATAAGAALLQEALSSRLLVSSVVILGGIGLAVLSNQRLPAQLK